jgi:hypothetical protein
MAKKKEMNRTSGVARRLTGRSEGIATKLKYGAPLTGSASGVKSISLKDAGEVLTQGIVSVNRKGLTADPAGLAFALPTGKVAKAAGLLLGKGKIFPATGLVKRLTAKDYGRSAAKEIARNAKTPNMAQQAAQDSYERVADLTRSGRSARGKSELVFPRAPKKSPRGKPDLGDLAAKETPFMTPQLYRRYVKASQKAAEGTRVTQLEKRLKLPKGK